MNFTIEWNQPGTKRYESGLDRGVLYLPGQDGVPWNGLRSVKENPIGGEVSSYHFDGIKYNDVVSPIDFQATLEAFTYPDEFAQCIGIQPAETGLLVTGQTHSRFGLSYRTGIENDIDGAGFGYKIHLIYNATASTPNAAYATKEQDTEVDPLTWTIDAIPETIPGFRPTAHYILDSTLMGPGLMEDIETRLYGTSMTSARLPSLADLIQQIILWDPRLIQHNRISGLSPLVSGYGDLSPTIVSGIYRRTFRHRLNLTPAEGLYRIGAPNAV